MQNKNDNDSPKQKEVKIDSSRVVIGISAISVVVIILALIFLKTISEDGRTVLIVCLCAQVPTLVLAYKRMKKE